MKKEFKGMRCVYCSTAEAITADHVFSRKFFVEQARTGLPQVPSCDKCNSKKGALEQYLTAVLPFGGRHSAAQENLETLVPGRLKQNLKLHRELADGQVGNTIPLREGALEGLMAYIARGLIWYHWKTYLNDETHELLPRSVSDANAQVFADWLANPKVANRVSGNWGDGTFLYEGIQTTADPALTIWRISMYGGLTIGLGEDTPKRRSSQFLVISSSRASVTRIRAKITM